MRERETERGRNREREREKEVISDKRSGKQQIEERCWTLHDGDLPKLIINKYLDKKE